MNKKALIAVVIFMAVAAIALLVMQPWTSSSKTINLGATFPLTGEVASYGLKGKRGIEMAVAELNAQGGLLGRQVQIDFQDDRNDKKESVSIFTKFATIDKVPVVFGSAGSTVTLAMVPLANRYKVILISPISSSAKLSTEGGPYFFRTSPADDLQAEILAQWVLKSGFRRVALVYTNNSWGKPLAEGFTRIFEANGGKVLLTEGVPENTSDFRTIIAKMKDLSDLQAVVSPTYPKEGGIFVRQCKELALGVTLFGGDNWGSPEFRNIAGSAAEGVFYTAPSEIASPSHKAFAQRYAAQYGEAPDVFSAYAYDAATAVFKAILAADSFDPEKIRQSLAKITFDGVSGPIAFKLNGDRATQTFVLMTIKSGHAIVSPQ